MPVAHILHAAVKGVHHRTGGIHAVGKVGLVCGVARGGDLPGGGAAGIGEAQPPIRVADFVPKLDHGIVEGPVQEGGAPSVAAALRQAGVVVHRGNVPPSGGSADVARPADVAWTAVRVRLRHERRTEGHWDITRSHMQDRGQTTPFAARQTARGRRKQAGSRMEWR
eukprot:CAMPEP_0117668370 /NCGR_PEP_ID=MMETSP0804-20121206/11509_1 /TAXON_ID=1074897 /ORGANISM="Tetraselmis astigmatica, Strain CCMP880" /LENGTH=166 /DNA_ID=CAMNT_0005476249 /DNA_START=377 /DNA_END=877 /DNA_ORIENTATION=-